MKREVGTVPPFRRVGLPASEQHHHRRRKPADQARCWWWGCDADHARRPQAVVLCRIVPPGRCSSQWRKYTRFLSWLNNSRQSTKKIWHLHARGPQSGRASW